MSILNTQEENAAIAERDSSNEKLRAQNQRIEYTAVSSLHDTRTNAKLYELFGNHPEGHGPLRVEGYQEW